MAVAGPFDSRNDADQWVTNLITDQHRMYPCCQLTIGPDDLGPEWALNLSNWLTK